MNGGLTRFAWLSITAAIVTIGLKAFAYYVTGSVGLLSDALESIVNLVAASFALLMLKWAAKPPDEDHMYGHNKAEYFSSIIEGILIVVAAVSIIYTATDRLFHPRGIEQVFLGLFISSFASLINFVVAYSLLKAGKKYHSITLEADAHHLFTDVWTSIGVIVGVFAVSVTKINALDPIIAILVGLNIVYTGIKIMKRSVMGFMDVSISKEEQAIIIKIFNDYEKSGLKFHGLRTRQSAARRFISFHVLFPGKWSVQKSHNYAEKIECDIRKSIPNVTVTTHLEPVEDRKSWNDEGIDKT
ncbi:MAG: cation diffusion facilitator family transporter [Patescibacteria group bacterium]|nr:cation diffusion facilitator family transporter [Actinomycetota bacterium]MCL5410532.1 cation diffusion facilitator family transporter [Patescibacteria group bacterium]